MYSRDTYSTAPGPSGQRKSRADGAKVSLIPKPKLSRQGSYERLSETGWRGGRPRSLEPPRPSVSISRLSREQSATKKHSTQRSRSGQQSEGRPFMTPLSKHKPSTVYSRVTATPMITPSAERSLRSWTNCLDRAIACVTVPDKRPISNAAWQKETFVRVNEELERRSGGALLIKPLTINRFVDITSSLLVCLMKKGKLDTANYITKLPNMTKRLLYPGAVSKSWLKTVNTLHTYASALALIAYLMDLVIRVETPFDEEVIYMDKGELSSLKRKYDIECWISFNNGCDVYTTQEEDYIRGLQEIVGDSSERRAALAHSIQEYQQRLEDPAEVAAREDEQRRVDLLNQLAEMVRELKSKRIQDSGQMDAAFHHQSELIDANHQLQTEIERLQQEIEEVQREVSSQPLSTAERAALLDKVEYFNRVIESKNDLLQHLTKMLYECESELALSQKKCLAACVEYNQWIITLTSAHADCAGLAIEVRELVNSGTVCRATDSLSSLRDKRAALADELRDAERARAAVARRRSEDHYQPNQTTRLESMMKELNEAKQALRSERDAWATERAERARKLAELGARTEQHNKMAAELAREEMEAQEEEEEDRIWCEKLSELSQFVEEQEALATRRLRECRDKRAALLSNNVLQWNNRLKEIHARYAH